MKNNFVFIVLLLCGACLVLLPTYWMFLTAFTPEEEIIKMPPSLLPKKITLENFRRIFILADPKRSVGRWFINSTIVAVSVTVTSLFVSSLAAYSFARKKFKGRELLFYLFVATMMIPGEILTIPMFLLVKKLNLLDTLWAVILPAIPAPFGIFMLRQFMQDIPYDIEEAARIDGCSELTIFFRIILPLTIPALTALGIFMFITQWNMFLWPLIVLSDATKYTLQVGLASLQEQHVRDFGLLMAGASIASIPIIILFFTFQRYLVRGLASIRG
ncbi:MAG: carbohydrate ABC transporter permease [Endomicrobia bacterium]|nr:carbohydrate ABC transporter permease [Endomicrobiia bacterium]